MVALTSGFDQGFVYFVACRLDIQTDAQWLEVNLGPFAKEVEYSALKELNITGVRDTLFVLSNFPVHTARRTIKQSGVLPFQDLAAGTCVNFFSSIIILLPQLATLDSLSPEQKAELVLDPSTGALENVTVLTEVFVSVTTSPEVEQLDDFFQTFVIFTIQVRV